MNRQRMILFILVILFGVAALWSYSALPRLKTVESSGAKPSNGQKRAVVAATDKTVRAVDDGTKLHISLLDSQSSAFKGYRRNIFKPVFVDEVKMNKQQAVALKPPQSKIVAPPPPPPPPPVTVQPEASPLAHFTFLGFLKKGAEKTIFLSKDKDILLVKKGDKIAGRYLASDISDQALTLTVTDTGDEIVIPLLENRPLATAR